MHDTYSGTLGKDPAAYSRQNRLAFDIIGLCAFNYRFNAFYGENLPEFAVKMADVLIEAGKRAGRIPLENELRFLSKRKMMDQIHFMWKICDDLVADRKAHPRPDINDLLNVMLTEADPVTGKKLPDENIRFQMATFLVSVLAQIGIIISYIRSTAKERGNLNPLGRWT